MNPTSSFCYLEKTSGIKKGPYKLVFTTKTFQKKCFRDFQGAILITFYDILFMGNVLIGAWNYRIHELLEVSLKTWKLNMQGTPSTTTISYPQKCLKVI